jgi:hypothetical protein
VFYTLHQAQDGKPTFQRESQTCLVCHDSSSVTGGVPGFIMRSVVPDRYGYGIAPVGKSVTTDQTPLAERWGGWYVTGTHGDQAHMGNVIAPVLAHEVGNLKTYLATAKLPSGANVTDLHGRVDVDPYLTPHSDIVGMMVLAHQTSVHNLITRAGYDARVAEREGDRNESRVRTVGEPLVRASSWSRLRVKVSALSGVSGSTTVMRSFGPKRLTRSFNARRIVAVIAGVLSTW